MMESTFLVQVGFVEDAIAGNPHDTCFVSAEYPSQALKRAFPSMEWTMGIRRAHDGVFVFGGKTHWAEVKELSETLSE